MKVSIYLLITFLWSWISWFAGLHYLSSGINGKTIEQFIPLFFIGVYGPFLAGIITTAYFDGVSGVVALLKKLILWRAPIKVYAVIVFLPLVCLAFATGMYGLFVGNIGHFDGNAIAIVPIILLRSLFAGPLGEELGWRGFLLPELKKKHSSLTSSLIIGVIWYCWHIPLFFAPFGTLVSGAPLSLFPLLIYLIFVLSLSCIYTWLVNQSKGSVLISILIHLSINAGILLLFFPALNDQAKKLYLISTSTFFLFAVYLAVSTRLEQQRKISS